MKYFTIIFLLIVLASQGNAVTICNSDYNITNYNLLCPFDNQFIFVNQIQALYSTTATSCNAAPNLVLNVSTNAVYTVCQFCRYRQPCVIAAPLILQNGLFNSSIFNQQTLAPYNIKLSYLCLTDQTVQCTNILPPTTTVTTTTVKTTTTTTSTTTKSLTTTTVYTGPVSAAPGQPTIYPGQPTAYTTVYTGPVSAGPGQPTAYPGQPTAYPTIYTGPVTVTQAYTGPVSAGPGQPTLYPGQPTAYTTLYTGPVSAGPGQPTVYPGQPTAYPGQVTTTTSQNNIETVAPVLCASNQLNNANGLQISLKAKIAYLLVCMGLFLV